MHRRNDEHGQKKSITEQWAYAVINYNIRPHEFWELNIEQLNALKEAHEEKRKEQEYYSALICSVMANINRGKNGKTYKPDDFIRRRKKKQTVREMHSMLDMIARAYDV